MQFFFFLYNKEKEGESQLLKQRILKVKWNPFNVIFWLMESNIQNTKLLLISIAFYVVNLTILITDNVMCLYQNNSKEENIYAFALIRVDFLIWGYAKGVQFSFQVTQRCTILIWGCVNTKRLRTPEVTDPIKKTVYTMLL